MRDIASCFGEYAVSVADSASCASSSTQPSPVSPVQDASTSLYNITLSTQKKLMITVTWCKTQTRRELSIGFDNSSLPTFKLKTSSMFKRLKGMKIFETKNTKVEVLWDVSAAKYQNGPEPVNGYYVLILIDSELGLSLGDMAKDETNKRIKKGTVVKAKCSLVSRREQCNGSTVYSTRARFSDAGALHDITIRCVGENHHKTNSHQPSLCVCIDKRTVIQVKRLQWNFRGNQSIFIDGLEIDLLWDVHDWLFNSSSSSSSLSSSSASASASASAAGYAVFAFRSTNGIQNANWSDHKLSMKHQDKQPADFTLLIHACKTS